MKDIIRMNQLAGLITENQARKMINILNEEQNNPSPEQAVQVAKKVVDKLEDTKEFQQMIDKIAADPKASAELLKLSGMNENQGLNEDLVDTLALKFAKKADQLGDKLQEEKGFDFGGAFWTGLLGGGALAYKLSWKPFIDAFGNIQSHLGGANPVAVVGGAIAGAVLAVLAKAVYDKIKG